MKKNKQHFSFLRILTGSDLSNRRIPFMEMESPENGPVVWLTGCMHGDEIGGTVVIHEVFKRLRKKLKRGCVKAFPLMNPFGFESITRNISYSKEDLNRSFPGNPSGTLAERIAAIIFESIVRTEPALVVDLHNDWKRSIPYALSELIGEEHIDNSVHQYSMQTGLLQIEDTDNIRSSLTHSLMQKGIPALVLELGESFIINEHNIAVGVNAIMNLLIHLDMIADPGPLYEYPLVESLKGQRVLYAAKPLSSTSGIVRFLNKPGDIVAAGQKIAKICNAYGKQVEVLYAIENAIIIGQTDSALAFPGSPVMAFGHIPTFS